MIRRIGRGVGMIGPNVWLRNFGGCAVDDGVAEEGLLYGSFCEIPRKRLPTNEISLASSWRLRPCVRSVTVRFGVVVWYVRTVVCKYRREKYGEFNDLLVLFNFSTDNRVCMCWWTA